MRKEWRRTDPMEVNPIVLEGEVVRLEPLSMEHYDALCKVGLDPEIWRWYPFPFSPSSGDPAA